MEAKELRIGNILYFPVISKNIEVIGINAYETDSGDIEHKISLKDGTDLHCVILENLKPISLTEEWLIKFGFENLNYGWSFDKLSMFDYNYKKGELNLKLNTLNIPIMQINTVHQLQNLYFALTGEELTTKKPIY